MVKIMTAREAVRTYLKNGSTVGIEGFIGLMRAEEMLIAIRDEFLETGNPNNLTIVHCAGQGNGKDNGMNHLGYEGIIGKIYAGHFNMAPAVQKLILDNKIAAYNVPQGVIAQLYREIAGHRPGVITNVGLNTFADPRVEGCKLNQKAKDAGDVVELINIMGEEKLLYKAFPIDVCILRATYADTQGNCSMQKEPVTIENLAMAQAAKNSGGKVIVQVEEIVEYGSLDARFVNLPGIYVDAVVKAKADNHLMGNETVYNPAMSGEVRVPVSYLEPMKLNERKIIARRSAMELVPNAITNLGIGMPEGVAAVAAEEGLEGMVLTTEAGTIGGIPCGAGDFGGAVNPDCILDQPYQFDFYDGGGLDVAFLGLAQMDKVGNINVSKFGPKVAGCGGFVNITQNSKKVVYCGTFTTGGLRIGVDNGKLIIKQEGKVKKFLNHVEQITFSGEYAAKVGQPVLYVTERAVFALTPEGVELKEIAPGIDLEKDVLALMEFKPIIKDVKLMDERIFKDEKMGLSL
ncbi:MAG: 3-oxoacid CoA-transferase [Oscillospiraceae bacterium]|nr:3-oxoacid CoA-transferase [Oscillospiraceae bacterium]